MDPADVDTCMRLGAGHPMGPLALLDLVGLDVSKAIGETIGETDPSARAASSSPRAPSDARAGGASTATDTPLPPRPKHLSTIQTSFSWRSSSW